MDFTKYNSSTGEIVATGAASTTEMAEAQAVDGCSILLGSREDPKTRYIDLETDSAVDRPAMPASIDKTEIDADETDEAVVSDLPVGTVATIYGVGSWEVDDDEFVLTVDTPGEYTIYFNCFPYLEKEFVVDAVEP